MMERPRICHFCIYINIYAEPRVGRISPKSFCGLEDDKFETFWYYDIICIYIYCWILISVGSRPPQTILRVSLMWFFVGIGVWIKFYQLILIDFNVLPFICSIDFQLISVYVQLIFNWLQFMFNWFSIDFNLRSIDFQLISTYFQLMFNWFQLSLVSFSIDCK